jgi:ribonuclease VapC
MIVDSSALLAILQFEAEHVPFRHAIARASTRLVSATTLLETSMVILGRQQEQGIAELDDLIASSDIRIVPFDARHASLALDAFRRYGKGRHRAGLNMGDCFSYALAKATGLPLLFKGDDFVHTDVKPAV